MRMLREWLQRLGNTVRPGRRDDDLQEELRLHTTLAAEAGRRPGGTAQAMDALRDQRGLPWLDDLARDVRHGLRSLRRSPVFTAVAVVTLALGIGANTAIFSVMQTVLFRLLPVEQPQELVFLQTVGGGSAPPYPYFERVRDETSSFAGLAAFATDELGVEVDGVAEQVFGQVASGTYFEVLGVRPAVGRLLTRDDEQLDPPVAVIGYGYWQRRFGGAANAIGRTLSFRNRLHTIVGVTPAGFQGLEPGRQVDVTLPITLERGMVTNVEARWFNAVARLRPDATVQQATVQADAILQSFMNDRNRSRSSAPDHVVLAPASRGLDQLRRRFSGPLYVLTLAVAILLLIACVNLGGLLLVRGAARGREFAVRLATGAGSGRLLRQVLTETLVLFLLGAAAGLVIAYGAIQGLTGFFAAGRRPILLDVQFDWRLVTFAAAATLAAGLVTGMWPALRALRTEPQTVMKGNGTWPSGSWRWASGRMLVAGQVALSLALLVIAVLAARTMGNLRAVDLGFSPGGVLTMSLQSTVPRDGAAREPSLMRVVERVRGLPGVRAASLSVLTPLSGRNTGTVVTVPGAPQPAGTEQRIGLNHVSEDYFRAFGIELVAGRAFAPRDASGALKVVVLNEAAARTYFPGRSPIGQAVEFGQSGAYQVVGVVRDHKHVSVRDQAPPFAFVPVWQPIDALARLTLAVSSDQPQSTIARAVGDEVRAIDPSMLVSDVIGVEAQIDATLVSERLLSNLSTTFAALVLGLAVIGLYGIVSYSVAGRRKEFGVRIALGASRSRVVSGVVKEALLPVGAGIAIGLPLALVIARAADRLLFGVASADPTNYMLGAGTLVLVACAAAWLPARRASRLDPNVVLRAE